MMGKWLTLLALSAFVMIAGPREGRAVAIDPIAGASGNFSFDLGSTTVDFPAFGTDDNLDFVLASPSSLSISVFDCCVSGDIFDLLIDDVLVAWDVEGFVGGLFQATISGLLLGAGAHTIDFGIEAYCCTFANGGFGEYTIRGTPSAVPLPGAVILLLTGIGALGGLKLRRRSSIA